MCEDGELAECINLTTDHEELKVVPRPKAMFGGEAKAPIVYVHEGSGYKNYLTLSSRILAFFDEEGHSGNILTLDGGGTPQIAHVGYILVVSDGEKMEYFLWKPGERRYSSLGSKIPEPDISIALGVGLGCEAEGDSGNMLSFSEIPGTDYYTVSVAEGKKKECTDLILGLYAESVNKARSRKMFTRPFYVRYALEMYDGSYVLHSAPIALFPALTENCYARYSHDSRKVSLNTTGYKIMFRARYDYSEWSSIVKNVVVFASDGVSIYDTTKIEDSFRRGYYVSGGTVTGAQVNNSISIFSGSPKYRSFVTQPDTDYVDFRPLTQRDGSGVLADMKSVGLFYRLFKMGIRRNDGAWVDSTGLIDERAVENLTTQDQLDDDYYSHAEKIGGRLFSYNSRMILSSVRRGFFEGFGSFLPYSNERTYSYVIDVTIDTPEGEVVVRKTVETDEKMGLYFFYPDPRAKKVEMYLRNAGDNYQDYFEAELTEHPFLNGSYYFGAMPDGTEQEPVYGGEVHVIPEAAAGYETLSNQLFTSEVSNPFVFTPKGIKSVGTGRIMSLATLTTALSQGQFGQHPVVVFSSDGIWAMEVDKEGYLTPAQSMSREVCINANTILETDGSVFFASKKGLMAVVGNTTSLSVKCVSGQMDGRAFNTGSIPAVGAGNDWSGLIASCADDAGFLQYIRSSGCFLAYDYIDDRILIINPQYDYSYLYGMSDGTLSKYVSGSGRIVRAVSCYPDYLLQCADGTVWSLYGKDDETEVTARQQGFLITRPMKLSGPVSVKSLRELVNVGFWSKKNGSKVKTLVFVSDNLEDWYTMESRFGAAAKYFRLALYIEMLPTERLSGTVIFDQERRNDNARA